LLLPVTYDKFVEAVKQGRYLRLYRPAEKEQAVEAKFLFREIAEARRYRSASVQVRYGIPLVFISCEHFSVQVDTVSNMGREKENWCDGSLRVLCVLSALTCTGKT
jgi:hypothetical protein